MARVKVCRLCGQHNEPDELFCVAADCGASLADVSAVDTSELERREAEDNAADGGGGDGGGGESSVEGQQNQAANVGGHTMRDGQVSQAAPCALMFPWGRVPVAGQLGVGRDAGFSPISGRLDAFPTVSRRHAVVGAAQGQWTVRDLGSTNGTYVNGTRLAEGETRAIQNGDQIGFSQGLQVKVEIAETGGASGTPSY